MNLRILLVAAILAWGSHAKAADPAEVARLERGASVLVLTKELDACEHGMTMFLVLHPHARGFKGCWFVMGSLVFLVRGDPDDEDADVRVIRKERFKFADS